MHQRVPSAPSIGLALVTYRPTTLSTSHFRSGNSLGTTAGHTVAGERFDLTATPTRSLISSAARPLPTTSCNPVSGPPGLPPSGGDPLPSGTPPPGSGGKGLSLRRRPLALTSRLLLPRWLPDTFANERAHLRLNMLRERCCAIPRRLCVASPCRCCPVSSSLRRTHAWHSLRRARSTHCACCVVPVLVDRTALPKLGLFLFSVSSSHHGLLAHPSNLWLLLAGAFKPPNLACHRIAASIAVAACAAPPCQ